jgi:hypothetical protein
MSSSRFVDVTVRSLSGSFVILLGCVSNADPSSTEPQAVLAPRALPTWNARPAPGPYPVPPGIEFPEGEPAPAPAPLGRDSAVVGRLTQEGQRAALTFEAEAGELSLFDLTAYGYARGWDSTSTLVVRDAEGAVLAEKSSKGPAQFSDFLPFTAPRAGAYTLELVATEHYFRYVVVRHSGYRAAQRGEVFALADAGDLVVHGLTGGPRQGDSNDSKDAQDAQDAQDAAAPAHNEMRFLLRGEPGAPVALRVEPTIERGWKHKRSLREGAAAVTAGLADARRLEQRMDPRLREDRSFPDFTVKVEDREGAGKPLAEGAFSAFVRFPASGVALVTVGQSSDGPGGLFDLFVERSLTLVPCTLRIGNTEDEDVADVEIVLLREPALERFGAGKTAADGTLTLEAPPGSYTVVFRAPGRGPSVERAVFDGVKGVNLMVDR